MILEKFVTEGSIRIPHCELNENHIHHIFNFSRLEFVDYEAKSNTPVPSTFFFCWTEIAILFAKVKFFLIFFYSQMAIRLLIRTSRNFIDGEFACKNSSGHPTLAFNS